MTVQQIKGILRDNNFNNPADRIYWENELRKAESRENAFANNQKKIQDYEKGWKR